MRVQLLIFFFMLSIICSHIKPASCCLPCPALCVYNYISFPLCFPKSALKLDPKLLTTALLCPLTCLLSHLQKNSIARVLTTCLDLWLTIAKKKVNCLEH